MRINLFVLAFVGGLAVLALSGCSGADVVQVKERTFGDALVRAGGLHEDRREWDDKGQDLRKGFLETCERGAAMASASAESAEDWRIASQIWTVCMNWHAENGPKLLISDLASEIRDLYRELTDDQIERLGLPPRTALR